MSDEHHSPAIRVARRAYRGRRDPVQQLHTCRFSRSAASAGTADLGVYEVSHVDCTAVCLTNATEPGEDVAQGYLRVMESSDRGARRLQIHHVRTLEAGKPQTRCQSHSAEGTGGSAGPLSRPARRHPKAGTSPGTSGAFHPGMRTWMKQCRPRGFRSFRRRPG